MNARDLHAYFAKYSEHEWSPENYQTILRALKTQAAVDESSDGLVRELQARAHRWRTCAVTVGLANRGGKSYTHDAERDEQAAARIAGLEASISAERANGERERGMRDQHITRLETELASVKAERDALKAFRDYFTDKCEGLFFQFGMEVIDLYNATHGHKDCHIEPDRAAHPKDTP